MGLKRPDGTGTLHEVREREHARDLEGLLAQLHDADAARRRWAARDLAGFPQAVPELGARLHGETDPSVREALFTTLAGHAGEPAVDVLLPLLRSEDAGLRNGAIEALAGMPQAVAPRMQALLHDADPDVRIFTVNLLADLPHADVTRWLASVLHDDAQVNVVAAAIEVLAETGTPAELPVLQAARERFAGDPFIGFAADMAIERIEAA